MPVVSEDLYQQGLTLQGVVSTKSNVGQLLEIATQYSQLLVFGHAGRSLWAHVSMEHSDPIDTYSRRIVTRFLQSIACDDHHILYPLTDYPIDLREIGRYLGWHHESPLGIGIHPKFGTWFAYRVVVAANTDFAVTVSEKGSSACESCRDKPCVSACPVTAVSAVNTFGLDVCVSHRRQEGSSCSHQCLARQACPVGKEYQYEDEQIAYHYGRSLAMIKT